MTADELRTQKALALLAVNEAEQALESASDACTRMLSTMRDALDVLERQIRSEGDTDNSSAIRGAPAGILPRVSPEERLLDALKPCAGFFNIDAITAVYARKAEAGGVLREAKEKLAVFSWR